MIEKFLNQLAPCRVIGLERAAWIDLSVSGPHRDADITDSYIHQLIVSQGADFLIGGYNEQRAIYRRSGLFGDERNIHIGLDLWAPAGTAVLAPVDGIIHSFDYNTGVGNYGPTVILQHKIGQIAFYTLYGHLSAKSLEELETGDLVLAGTVFAQLGHRHENGDYAPHLHFQIIIDLEGNQGDYPGVCSKQTLSHYLNNCPDPNLLLKLTK